MAKRACPSRRRCSVAPKPSVRRVTGKQGKAAWSARRLSIPPCWVRGMESLRALQAAFPCLPVTLLTEGLGATEQRLREGQARFAIYSILTTGADDLEADFLT